MFNVRYDRGDMRMAEYCARCGKKIGFLGGINELFPDKKGRGVCDDCEKDFKFKIDVEIQGKKRNGLVRNQGSNMSKICYEL